MEENWRKEEFWFVWFMQRKYHFNRQRRGKVTKFPILTNPETTFSIRLTRQLNVPTRHVTIGLIVKDKGKICSKRVRKMVIIVYQRRKGVYGIWYIFTRGARGYMGVFFIFHAVFCGTFNLFTIFKVRWQIKHLILRRVLCPLRLVCTVIPVNIPVRILKWPLRN